MKRLFDAFQLVKHNLEKAMWQQKKQYDKRAKDFEYRRTQGAIRRPFHQARYKQKTVFPLPRPKSGNKGPQ